MQVHAYEVHPRFGYLRAGANLPRLQLAALYAATCCLLPEPGSGLTGTQTALKLLRQCWTNQPLTPEQAQQLQSVARLGGHLAPALHLLAYELHLSSSQVQHYQSRVLAAEGTTCNSSGSSCTDLPALDPDAGTAYLLSSCQVLPGGFPAQHRLRLSPEEEARTLGSACSAQVARGMPAWQRLGQCTPVDRSVPDCPVAGGYVTAQEQALLQLVQQPQVPAAAGAVAADGQSDSGSVPPYPLKVPAAAGGGAAPGEGLWLEQDMHVQLERSWQAHHSRVVATAVLPGAQEAIKAMQV